MTGPSDAQIAHALRCASYYRTLGWQPLPSRMDRKGPMLDTFADYWDTPAPPSIYEDWRTTNIQIMCGARWKLCVVDCDGDEAHEVWTQMVAHSGGMPATWRSRTGGGGWHYYFALPDWIDDCPSRRMWGVWDTWSGTNRDKPGSPQKGDWQKHKEVRLLADRALVIAPPSIHVATGRPYEFAVGPRQMPRPAEAPGWLLRAPAIERPECLAEAPPPPRFLSERAPARAGRFPSRDEVLAAIPNKAVYARDRWGLRTASAGPDGKGWWSVWAVDRKETRASSQVHEDSGIYWCGRERSSMSFFDLGVALGVHSTWQDCKDELAAEFCPESGPPARA